MPQTYACRRCGKTYSLQMYEQSRFCPDCGTHLMQKNKVSKLSKRTAASSKVVKVKKATTISIVNMPERYEARKGQMEFIVEASKTIKDGGIFLGSAPCGIGKSLASLLAVLPQLG
ncbi:MAG: hypothetical protein OEY95_04920, partial [Candidatus Bathyarchaeota archaeon]|nr:hypothetical protein [Candidatus Bathyarchaeota archaeon]